MDKQDLIAGLVLAGGQSSRMGMDKGLMRFEGQSLRYRAYRLLLSILPECYISCREAQNEKSEECLFIFDQKENIGPASGLLSAHDFKPHYAWLVVACDLPLITCELTRKLLNSRALDKDITLFRHSDNIFLEPLVAIWEPSGLQKLARAVQSGSLSLLECVDQLFVSVIEAEPYFFTNVNTPRDFERCGGRLNIAG